MTQACIVQCAAGSEAEAEAIAHALLEARLAACVQLTPIRSRYLWKREIARDDEVMLAIKTRVELFETVRAKIRVLHGYETPEILSVVVDAADPDYLAWLVESTASD